MKKNPLIGISIIAVVLLVLGSLSNVVGYQSIQSSNQQIINKEINQKELLFQTILDMTNNKEIQRVILNSQISREGFYNPEVKFSKFTPQVLTKNQLKHMYLIGLIFSKTINKSKIHSMVELYQLDNQGIQKDINVFIKKDAVINREITLLSNLGCDCENNNFTWHFPILCTLLLPFAILSSLLVGTGLPGIAFLIGLMIMIPTAILAYTLHCWWL